MRSPISRVRWLTENETRPYTPAAASSSATIANTAEHAGEQIRAPEIFDEHALHAADVVDRLGLVELRELAADRRRKLSGIGASAAHDEHRRSLRPPRAGHVHLRRRSRSGVRVPDVADHADHLEPLAARRRRTRCAGRSDPRLGQYLRAASRLTRATGGALPKSAGTKPRPRTIGTRIVFR